MTTERGKVSEHHQVLLFVCTGNTCRSPMAEAIARAELDRRDLDHVVVMSAGTSAASGGSATVEACRAVEALGMHMHAHRAQLVTADLLDRADRVFAMTENHLLRVSDLKPDAPVSLLDPSGDIEDPIGMPQSAYDRTARRLQELIAVRIDELFSSSRT